MKMTATEAHQKGRMTDIVSKVSSYAWSAEQIVLSFTLSVLGASVGLFEGTFKGFQKLQPSLTSREGLEDLLYGSNHKERKGSISDLLASWIPFMHHHQPITKRGSLRRSRTSCKLPRCMRPLTTATSCYC